MKLPRLRKPWELALIKDGINKRKNYEDMLSNKRHINNNMEIVKPAMAVVLNSPRLYPLSHKGHASVEIIIKKEFVKKTKNHNQIFLAKTIATLNVGVYELKPRGHNKAEALFRTKEAANAFDTCLNSVRIKESAGYVVISTMEKRSIYEAIKEAKATCGITFNSKVSNKNVTANLANNLSLNK
ncbi:hypothetical protein KPH14_009741 [Odynerus spinipes]|uniref:Uncharacterized protein n=1 Tax=Odynerus spinipes TaxID=1348599 RepID=A0AAD9RGJ0_9HYME|nr:hypothetical protein KPH14_009741 [Odynerus spinipes]